VLIGHRPRVLRTREKTTFLKVVLTGEMSSSVEGYDYDASNVGEPRNLLADSRLQFDEGDTFAGTRLEDDSTRRAR
jgi:hypothetical protein